MVLLMFMLPMALGILTGCTSVGPGFKAPVFPEFSGETVQPAEIAPWWTRYNDPLLNPFVQTALAISKGKVSKNAVGLYKALGGGWE
jgi:outer membrane protein TolC